MHGDARGRAALTSAVVTAVAVAAVATGAALAVGDRDGSPQPTKRSHVPLPSPSPTVDPVARAATIVRDGNLVSYAAGAHGALLTVWQLCTRTDADDCAWAWQLESAGATHRGVAPGDGATAHRAGNGFVVKPWNRKGFVVDADGSVRAVVSGAPGAATTDAVLVWGRNDLLVIDPRTAHLWPLALADGVERWSQGMVAPDGTTWTTTMVDRQVWIAWNRHADVPSTWQHHAMSADEPNDALPGYVAIAGKHVATVSGYDGATILPVADFAVTADGGTTWADLHKGDLPFDTVDAMAATSDGTLYVVTAGGEHLFRTTDDSWTRFTEMPNPHRIDALVPAGDQVVGQGGSSDAPVLVALDARGRSTPVAITR